MAREGEARVLVEVAAAFQEASERLNAKSSDIREAEAFRGWQRKRDERWAEAMSEEAVAFASLGRKSDVTDERTGAPPQWVRAGERVPAGGKLVLLTVRGEATHYAMLGYWNPTFDEWRDEDGDSLWAEVLAWMPLPEPFDAG